MGSNREPCAFEKKSAKATNNVNHHHVLQFPRLVHSETGPRVDCLVIDCICWRYFTRAGVETTRSRQASGRACVRVLIVLMQ